ncbi:MAG: polymer-forming cytoskeletal protein [Elusimicrobiaceae bacterium]|nr:polymer-forming cytoskeletal protein [Elusimicrobiaceae bacterium]
MNKKAADRDMGGEDAVSVIGREVYFQGTVTARGSLRVDGRMQGAILEAHTVIVGEKGRVEGDITAENVVVGGLVAGNICSSGFTELLSGSTVKGDIRTAKLVVEEEARFDGRCSMNEAAAAEPPAGAQRPPKPNTDDEDE